MTHCHRELRARRNSGFSLIELTIVVAIISIVAALAQPSFNKALTKARAASVVGDLEAIKVAVFSYQAETSAWPPEESEGTIPTGLIPFLPSGFTFTPEDYSIDYEAWGGVPYNVGIAIVTDDVYLGAAVLDMLGKQVYQVGNKYAWVID
jgi:prepilin-type N-terminal cleavage/methylation domain-containing protein